MSSWTGDREYTEPAEARELLVRVPVTPLGALAENVFGRICGRVMPFREIGVLRAPVTRRSCVMYLVHIEVTFRGHRQQYGERHGVAFVVDDAGERAVIDPAHARVRIRYDQVSARFGSASMTAEERALVQRLRIPVELPDAQPPPYFVFQEARLEPGAPVTVCGAGIREADPQHVEHSGMYRGEPQTRLRIVGSRTNPIALSNDEELIPKRS
jgi:hypothetical protein